VDITSNLLGILDGTISIADSAIEIKITVQGQDEAINGELQDRFLAYDEDNR